MSLKAKDTTINSSSLWLKFSTSRRLLLVFFIVITTLTAGFLVKSSPYYKLSPGPAPNITKNLSGSSVNPLFKKSGQMYFTTVRVENTSWAKFIWLHMHNPQHDTFIGKGPVSTLPASTLAQQYALMDNSKKTAYVVARAKLDGKYPPFSSALKIIQVLPFSPAAKAGLLEGDIISKVNNTPITTERSLEPFLKDGKQLDVVVIRTNLQKTTMLSLKITPAFSNNKYSLGVRLFEAISLQINYTINTAGIAGPSGGLMFTLAFLDALGKGDLTAGKNIAGTGTISLNGTVGPISGIVDKILGAKKAGASVFFAPKSEYKEAVAAHIKNVTVVPVSTYTDAVSWLCNNGATSTACNLTTPVFSDH